MVGSKPRVSPSSARKPRKWLSPDLQLFCLNSIVSILVATVSMFFLNAVPVVLAVGYGFVIPGLITSSCLGTHLSQADCYEILIEQYNLESSSRRIISRLHSKCTGYAFTSRFVMTRPYVASFCGTTLVFGAQMQSIAVGGIGVGAFLGWSCFVLGLFRASDSGDTQPSTDTNG